MTSAYQYAQNVGTLVRLTDTLPSTERMLADIEAAHGFNQKTVAQLLDIPETTLASWKSRNTGGKHVKLVDLWQNAEKLLQKKAITPQRMMDDIARRLPDLADHQLESVWREVIQAANARAAGAVNPLDEDAGSSMIRRARNQRQAPDEPREGTG